ncbi:TonB-dependent receptor [Sphingobium estronivorans]|uniref:TonB-dependent receptor n=1 Tax=Sphingobium estronivorans TaxID=1577690 RepID=UPI0013C333AA|nr:TonB-dependent receptor [Sphingobium estronivorans]
MVKKIAAILLGSAALTPHVASAQDAANPNGLSDIVVTAQRREQNLQDVPISVQALGGAKLESQQIRSISDIATTVPNLNVRPGSGRSDIASIVIRGVGPADTQVTQDPSVALYQDGVYIGTSFGAGFEAPDLARVEVLRGPQGTLYGRNATGGAINLISNSPELGAFRYRLEGSVGNYENRRGVAMLNVPLGDQFAIRGAYSRIKRDGWIKNTGIGEDFAKKDRENARVALRFRPSSNFTADYAFDYSESHDTNVLLQPDAGPAVAGGTFQSPFSAPSAVPGGFIQTFGQTTYSQGFPASGRVKSVNSLIPIPAISTKVWGHTGTLEWQAADNLTIKSITGYRILHNLGTGTNIPASLVSIVTRFSPTTAGLATGTIVNNIGPNRYLIDETLRYRNFSQELQAIGSAELGSLDLEYVGGLYFFDDKGHNTTATENFGTGAGPLTRAGTDINNQSIAAFTELTFTPQSADKLHVTLGARVSNDKRQATRFNENSFSFAALGGFTAVDCANPNFFNAFAAAGIDRTNPANCNGVVQGAEYSDTRRNFSPALTVAYDVSADLNLYAKVVKGYKSHGTSSRSANPTNFANGFSPERILSYEVGAKGTAFDRRVRFNFAGFYMDYKGYQASVQTGGTAADRDFIAINGNKIYGVEGDFTVALVQGLTFSANGALLHPELGDDSKAVLRDTGQTFIERFINVMPYTPKRSYNLSLDFNREVGTDAVFDAHVGYSYRSESHTSPNASDDRTLRNSKLLDANIGITRKGIEGIGEVSLRLWGRNLTNRANEVGGFGPALAVFGVNGAITHDEPRTYGLTMIFRN